MDQNAKKLTELLARYDCLSSNRKSVDKVWQDIADYFVPHSAQITTTHAQGDNTKATKLLDDVGCRASEYLASELHSGLTNPSIKWFDLAMEEKAVASRETDIFLQNAKDLALRVFNSHDGGFPSQNHEFLLSIVTYGTSCMFIEDSADGIRFSTIHMSEIMISEDKYGKVDTVFRKFKLTTRQMVQRWGIDRLHDKMRDKAKSDKPDYDEYHEVLHVVLPREESDLLSNKNFAYASYYIDVENKHILSLGGYYECPYIVARLSKLAGEVYGRSPAWSTLPTVKLVNRIQETLVKAAQMQAMPVTLLAHDAVLMASKIVPNGKIVGGLSPDGVPQIQPLNIGGNLQISDTMIQSAHKAIRDSFFVDQLVFRDGAAMTATEVIQRQQEALKLLAPHIGRLQAEYLSPLIQKVISIMARKGELGRIPDELKRFNFEIDYIAPIAMLQKASEVQKFQQFMAFVAPLAQIAPQTLDFIDFDMVVQKIAMDLGVWKEIQRDPSEVQQERQQRQQMQQAQMALQGANMAGDVGLKLSEIRKNQGEIV